MAIAIFTILGTFAGALCVYLLTASKWMRIAAREKEVTEGAAKLRENWEAFKQKQQQILSTIETRQKQVDQRAVQIANLEAELNWKKITYDELQAENQLLKQDLQNLAIHSRKLDFDRARLGSTKEQATGQINDLGQRYLKDFFKWTESRLTTSNYELSRQRLQTQIAFCREQGVVIGKDMEAGLMAALQRANQAV